MNELDQNPDFLGAGIKKYYSDIGEVVSFIPRYHVKGGGGFRNPYFPRRRLGSGWGTTILSFFRPLLKKGLHAVVDVASKVASDAIEGQNVKDSLKKHGLSTVSNLLQKTSAPSDISESENDSTVSVKKGVSPAIRARRKPKIQTKKPKRGVTGRGVKKKKQRKKPVALKKKFPILEHM